MALSWVRPIEYTVETLAAPTDPNSFEKAKTGLWSISLSFFADYQRTYQLSDTARNFVSLVFGSLPSRTKLPLTSTSAPL